MTTLNVMIDIETLGTRPGCGILSIGACVFDNKGVIADTFERVISPASLEKSGLTFDLSTIMWWMQQSNEARAALLSNTSVNLDTALKELTAFIKETRMQSQYNALNIWANDPDFDLVILRAAYDKLDMVLPWQFWEHRSMRTVVNLVHTLKGIDLKKIHTRTGTYHRAVDDAVYQALVVADGILKLSE